MDITHIFQSLSLVPSQPNRTWTRPVERIHGLMHRHQVAVQERLTQTFRAKNSCHRLVDISGDFW
jgi:hypothetical protein